MEYFNGIALADGEKVVRNYEASILKKPKSKGYLLATNRRLIFTGEGSGISGKSVLVREVKIDQVSGIESFYGKGWSLAKLLLAIILTFIFLSMFGSFDSGFRWFFILALAWPAYIVYKMINNPGNQMALQIIASNQSPSTIGVSVENGTGILGSLFSFLGLGGGHAWMSVHAAGPGKHTEVMVRELGALVQDIQVMGDHAVEKWRQVELKENKASAAHQPNFKEQIAATIDKVSETKAKIQERNVSNNDGASSSANRSTCSCGTVVNQDDVFCGNCGKRLKKESSDEDIFG
ncbi:hypothetical protein BTR23_04070 [Alkalihalophilus pseudofirmus]|nr:hypothetical protein BTR23_04070 [Alkalihalophilus pseudofirmus]